MTENKKYFLKIKEIMEKFSKYEPLGIYLQKNGEETIKLTNEEIGKITGFPLDHSFLSFKKELLSFGYEVKKISLKEKWILFTKIGE